MPRANRFYLPGYISLITHRCHKREMLMKYPHEKQRLVHWLHQSKMRFDIDVLNYVVTSNHIHLIIFDKNTRTISKCMQLIAGRTAREYNMKNKRVGAFWSDRYHGTIVEKGKTLIDCLIYMDLNMVRAGAVDHPSDWVYGGYQEIFADNSELEIITKDLFSYCGFSNMEDFKAEYEKKLNLKLQERKLERESIWTESIAVGSEDFLSEIMRNLGKRVKNRQVGVDNGIYFLREPQGRYE
jgi:putative transposase